VVPGLKPTNLEFFQMNRRSIARNVQKGFTLIELMIVVAIIGILAAIAIPQYQTYVAKSQVSRVMSEAGSMKTAIEACILEGKTDVGVAAGECDPQATGSNLLNGATQGNAIPANTGVPQVTDPLVATTTITAEFGNNAAADLKTAGQNQLRWTRDANGSWACTTNVLTKYRPAGCAATLAAAG